jgi:hypothetical protein
MTAHGHCLNWNCRISCFIGMIFSVRWNTIHYIIQHRRVFLKEGRSNEALNVVICKPPYCGRRAASWVLNPERCSGLLCIAHSRSNSTKSPHSGAGNVSEPRHVTSRDIARSHVRVDQCVYASRAVEVPVVSVCLRSSCNHVLGRRTSRLALKVVVQNDRDFVVLIVL